MNIATILHTHGQVETTYDTIDSIKKYMTNDVLLLIDGAGIHNFDQNKIPVPYLTGFRHGFGRSPYRNIVLGLMHAANQWPDADWYCYMEYDCLVGSSAFKQDLLKAQENNVWIMGNDFREKQEDQGKRSVKMDLVEAMLGEKFKEIVYLLGAFLFYNKDFIKKLKEENFFEKFLYLTNDFQKGWFPNYHGPAAWDLIEHLMPTLAEHWGGKVGQFAKWSDKTNSWVSGNFRRYPIRWQPQLFGNDESLQASLMHPLKDYNHPIREFHRNKRLRKSNEQR